MPTEALQALATSGHALVRGGGQRGLVELLEHLGRVLHVEEVVVATATRSLVKSSHGLTLHTDHHRADFIVWHCIAQSDAGGETLLADGMAAYELLTLPQREVLQRVLLQEHSLFDSDNDQHAVITFREGEPRLYYSYWLADERLQGHEREAFEAFAAAIDRVPLLRLRLEPGDVLAIDNGRMLHGRTPIEGSMQRHLRRYWIEAAGRSTSS